MAVYDRARRRRSVRKGREAGCWLFVPFEELAEAGFTRDEAPPFYRLWVPKGRKTIQVQLYREP